ncbi:MAG: 16S rRNA (adenine(1518)-N(6)/adenine(1519)-N(6))-dimethyltransferase RsmA [Gemmatimonadota bacterium]
MHHRPKKSLGQNFLVDGNLQRKIVGALDLGAGDEVLEIGPGKGALTQHLAGKCRSLILVELDRDLADALKVRYEGMEGVRVISGDILEYPPKALTPLVGELKVVGNIPYNITTPILFHLLTPPRPKEILLMVQKEVGERILADPGTSAFGALTVGVRSVAGAARVLKVPASAFRPVPAVDSVVIRVSPHRPEPLTADEEESLRSLTRMAFQQRRKQFQSILRNRPGLKLSHEQVRALENTTGFDLRQRPETFSPEEFILLSRALRAVS